MIQSKAMLVNLSISAWTARKLDKKVSAEVERSHSATDAGRYNKLLVSKSLLDPISKLSGQMRDYHYSVTLPWSDTGPRLLPSALFMDYTAEMHKFKAAFKRCVDDLVGSYPFEVQDARLRLGTMYNPEDYPASWEIRDRFSIAQEFMPVPSAGDFRVDIDAEANQELRDSVTRSVAERQAAAVKATYDRARDVVSKIADRLSDPKAPFRDSLIENARDLCVLLDALNITDDPQITALRRDIEMHLLVDPAMLRHYDSSRAIAAGHAQRILLSIP